MLSTKQFDRLKSSVDWSNRMMEKPRRSRIDAVRQFVGSHYSDGGAEKRVPTNFLKLAVDIYVRQLAARMPQALYTTQIPELKPTAATMELRLNQIPDEINLTHTLRGVVTEALFAPWGAVKVGLHTVGEVLGVEYGSPFVDLVTLDDYFVDMSARRLDLIEYEGNDYWLPFDALMDSGWLKGSDRAGLKADEYQLVSPEGQDRADGVGVDETAEPFRDKIWLRDVWVPHDRTLVTYGVTSGRQLKVIDGWEGPKDGPYHRLGFGQVPGNLLPLPPVSTWRDLHELANALFRKLANQADSQKTVLGFPGGNDDSVMDFKNARDGDGIKYTGAKPESLTAGGVVAPTLAFYLQCRDLYSYFAGNIDTLGGLSPQTETVGQDKLLSEAAIAMLRDMAAETVGFIRGVFRDLAYYEWHDPVGDRIIQKPIPGTDLVLSVPWNQSAKLGSFTQYDLEIDIYTAQDNSPGVRLQKLGMVLQQYILPLAPLIQEQGGTINVQQIIEAVARYADLPELKDIVHFLYDDTGGVGEVREQPAKPANTTRTYERVTNPGTSPGGKSAVMQQLLAGGSPQPEELQAMMQVG